jgi:undecaprenyl-diphosphatase
MNFLESWDLGGSYGMELLHRPWLTKVMHFITAMGTTHVLAVVALLSFLFFLFIGRWRTGVCVLAAFLLAYGIEHAAKPWVSRPRPDLKWVEDQDKTKSPSFPSGHALLSMALYGSIALSVAAEMETRRRKLLIAAAGLVMPLLIGFSRLYLGVHYMSDVVGGLCAGLACVLLFQWIDQKWTAASQPTQLSTTSATAPYQPAHAPRALEQVQRTDGDQIQS